MSIRTYNKDHLKEHAGVALFAPVQIIKAPESGDPLVFWTQHPDENREVNLHPFATGQSIKEITGGKIFIPYSGRPELTLQLAPAIKEALYHAADATVKNYLHVLRASWRVLDAMEAAAAKAGQPMTRIEDVCLLTPVHGEFARRSRMRRSHFGTFRTLVDTTRVALGAKKTYWESPEDDNVQKHLPPEEQRRALRIAIKRICRSVLKRLALSDRLSQRDTVPDDPQEANLWRNVQHMRNVQKRTGKALPSTDELYDGVFRVALNDRGITLGSLRESIFPNRRDADAVWHQCLLNTGWNTSTLNTLDATKRFLFDHFKDNPNDSHRRFVLSPQTYDYDLVGNKARAGGKEQVITGQWKSEDGPGPLIKTYLKRVAPLREVLKQQLDEEALKYEDMVREGASYGEQSSQFGKIKSLEQGCRSVWLYVNRYGSIEWISAKTPLSGSANGKHVSFLEEVVLLLNMQRAKDNEKRARDKSASPAPLELIPHLTPRDFRLWYADYVYRASNGSILAVKKELNHSQLRTTSGYVNTNILNRESSDAARRFLDILVSELDGGRVDLTILAHLYRHGDLTSEQKVLLAEARTLPKSRMKVACKDAQHPPAHIKATQGDDCDVQRCLLCLENAVLLPESLDGIAMRTEELRALQGFMPIKAWVEDRFDIELKNNLTALRKFDVNQALAARKKWAHAIASGTHSAPGVPLASSPALMDLV